MRALVHTLPVLVLVACFGSDEPAPDDPLETVPEAPAPVVLFAVHSANVVVPLACGDPAKGTLEEGSACLGLMPDAGVTLDIGEGKQVAVNGRTSVQCMSGRAMQALDLEQRVDRWPVVTWSDQAVSWCPFEKAGPKDVIDPVLLTSLQQAAAALDLSLEAPASEDIRIEPIYKLDLDGDGQQDHVVRAIWPDPPPPEPAEDQADDEAIPEPPAVVEAQQELLVALGGYQVMRFALPLPQLVELTGAIDLDRDGRCEVVVAAEREDGSSVGLGRWGNGQLALITAYECGI